MPNASGTSASANSATECANAAATSPTTEQTMPCDEGGLVARAPHDRPDEPALNHRAEHAEPREKIAGS